jgi:hypothetical protein
LPCADWEHGGFLYPSCTRVRMTFDFGDGERQWHPVVCGILQGFGGFPGSRDVRAEPSQFPNA